MRFFSQPRMNFCNFLLGILLLHFFVVYFTLIHKWISRNDPSNVNKLVQLPDNVIEGDQNKSYEVSSSGTKPMFETLIEPKTILLWTPIYYKDNSWARFLLEHEGHWSQKQFCSYNCHFTVKKELLNSSDAVIFHGRDIKAIRSQNEDRKIVDPAIIPSTRMPSQYWVLDYLESPQYTSFDLDAVRGFFNLTMTYRADSDIPMHYCRLVNAPSREPMNQEEFMKNKTQMAAWIVSHCKTNSKREVIVSELQKYISVDVFGNCGKPLCNPKDAFQRTCYRQIGASYKFYLSFENSLCEDYVTEKFFNALDAGMIPVVYGGADYTRYAPEGSFIDVNSFASIKELAEYLLMLDKNPSEYLKYFEWRNHLRVDRIETLPRGWCNLCERLTKGNLPKNRWIEDLKSWWLMRNNTSVCKKLPPFL